MFPQGKTAFLVIHGIGEQVPLQTLDSFTRGMVAELRRQGAQFSVTHEIARRQGAEGEWVESYIRLAASDSDDRIDIHECYWANLTEEKASLGDIWRWLFATAWGTVRYYRDNAELRRRYDARSAAGGSWIRTFPIFRLVLSAIFLYPLILALSLVLPGSIRRALLHRLATSIVVGYVADVAIYTTTDEKSRFYAIRRNILNTSQALLEALLADDDCERVVVAGHSLGSVIAYDTLNRINIRANLDPAVDARLPKVASLITFGSPLDKIAFFFRERSSPEESIRRQLVAALHSFRAREQVGEGEAQPIASRIERKLEAIPWLNFYDPRDPVSGHLDYYREVANRELNLGAAWGIAHVAYWQDATFHREVLAALGGYCDPSRACSQ